MPSTEEIAPSEVAIKASVELRSKAPVIANRVPVALQPLGSIVSVPPVPAATLPVPFVAPPLLDPDAPPMLTPPVPPPALPLLPPPPSSVLPQAMTKEAKQTPAIDTRWNIYRMSTDALVILQS
jgi:hypothetical protein